MLLLNKKDECIELLIQSGRLPEAALFARTYVPSRVSEITKLWKQSLAATSTKVAQSLADPAEYENLFPGFAQQLDAEQVLKYVSRRRARAQTAWLQSGSARGKTQQQKGVGCEEERMS